MALLNTLSEFGAAPSLEGLTQTALHHMGELADVSSVFMTTKGLAVLNTVFAAHAHNPEVLKRACAAVSVTFMPTEQWMCEELTGRALQMIHAGIAGSILRAIRAHITHTSLAWAGLHALTLIVCAEGDPMAIQGALIQKGTMPLVIELLFSSQCRAAEEHERVTLAGIFILERLVSCGPRDASEQLLLSSGVRVTLDALKLRFASAELRVVCCRLLYSMVVKTGKLIHLALVRAGVPQLICELAADMTSRKEARAALTAISLLALLTNGYSAATGTKCCVDICEPEGCRAVAAAGGQRLVLDCLQTWSEKRMIKKINHFQLTMECFTVLWHVQQSVGETAVQEILEYNGGYKIILGGMRRYESGSYDDVAPFALGTEVVVYSCRPQGETPSLVFAQAAKALIAAGALTVGMSALRSQMQGDGDALRMIFFMLCDMLQRGQTCEQLLAPQAPRVLEAVALAMAKHPSHAALLTNGCSIFQGVWASIVCGDAWANLNSPMRERAIDQARPAVKPVCAAMLKFSTITQIQSSGSRVLEGFARAGLSKAVAAAGGVQALVSILKVGPKDYGNDPSLPADKVFGCATIALGELTNSRDFVKVFVAEGGVQAALRYIKQDQLPVCGAALCRTIAHCAKRLEDAQRESVLPQLKSALVPMRQFVELNHMRSRHTDAFETHEAANNAAFVKLGLDNNFVNTCVDASLTLAKKAFRQLLGAGQTCVQCGVQTSSARGCDGCSGPLALDVTTW